MTCRRAIRRAWHTSTCSLLVGVGRWVACGATWPILPRFARSDKSLLRIEYEFTRGRIRHQLSDMLVLAAEEFRKGNNTPDANRTHDLLLRRLGERCLRLFDEHFGTVPSYVDLERPWASLAWGCLETIVTNKIRVVAQFPLAVTTIGGVTSPDGSQQERRPSSASLFIIEEALLAKASKRAIYFCWLELFAFELWSPLRRCVDLRKNGFHGHRPAA